MLEEDLNIMYPTPVESEQEIEQVPEPEILPTSESVLNAGEPEPELTAVANPADEVDPFDWNELITPKLNNYGPRGTLIPETDVEGSVFMANLRQENTIGSFLSNHRSRDLSKVNKGDFKFYEHLTPEQLIDFLAIAVAIKEAHGTGT